MAQAVSVVIIGGAIGAHHPNGGAVGENFAALLSADNLALRMSVGVVVKETLGASGGERKRKSGEKAEEPELLASVLRRCRHGERHPIPRMHNTQVGFMVRSAASTWPRSPASPRATSACMNFAVHP